MLRRPAQSSCTLFFGNNFLRKTSFDMGKTAETANYREMAFSRSLPASNGRFSEKLMGEKRIHSFCRRSLRPPPGDDWAGFRASLPISWLYGAWIPAYAGKPKVLLCSELPL